MQQSTKRPVRCILFDLGSTLWTRKDEADTRVAENAGNAHAANILLQTINNDDLPTTDVKVLGSLLRGVVEKKIRISVRQNPEYEPDFVQATIAALHKLGIKQVDHALGEAIYEALRIRIPVSRSLFEDTFSTLNTLKKRGYILGVVTNRHYGGRPFLEDLKTMGMYNYFEPESMAISADLGIRKPNPDIFLYALRGLGVMPEEAAMVGDSLKADIAGAKRLNMLAVWKPKPTALAKKKDDAVKPDATIDQLSELLEIF